MLPYLTVKDVKDYSRNDYYVVEVLYRGVYMEEQYAYFWCNVPTSTDTALKAAAAWARRRFPVSLAYRVIGALSEDTAAAAFEPTAAVATATKEAV